MLERQLERFAPILGLQCAVALCFEKIVEELHVPLIIFDDVDSFRHYGIHPVWTSCIPDTISPRAPMNSTRCRPGSIQERKWILFTQSST